MRVKCLAQEHDTMSPNQGSNTLSGGEYTNQEATVPPSHLSSDVITTLASHKYPINSEQVVVNFLA